MNEWRVQRLEEEASRDRVRPSRRARTDPTYTRSRSADIALCANVVTWNRKSRKSVWSLVAYGHNSCTRRLDDICDRNTNYTSIFYFYFIVQSLTSKMIPARCWKRTAWLATWAKKNICDRMSDRDINNGVIASIRWCRCLKLCIWILKIKTKRDLNTISFYRWAYI